MVKRITRGEIDELIEMFSAAKSDTSDGQTALDGVIAALTRCRRHVADGHASPIESKAEVPASPSLAPAVGTLKSGPFFGMGMREASVKQLEIAGAAQTSAEIWRGLSAGGFMSAHNHPASAVQNALIRRARTHGDVLLIGKGKWDLKSRYTEVQLAAIAEMLDGTPGRDHASHRESTKKGMMVARERGARFGVPPKLTEESALIIKQLRAAGKSARIAAEAAGVSHSTVYNWESVIAGWTPGEPWPPPDAHKRYANLQDDNSGPRLKVVK